MPKTVSRFLVILVVALGITFSLHIFILNFFKQPLFGDKIVLSYVVNALLAGTIFFSLQKLKERYKTQIGFLFLFGSALKFVVFFSLFFPSYKADGVMDKLEFAAFFVPYVVCLVLETYSLSQMLNKMS
ncbi:MAG: hypothetical protein KDD16_00715 [Mangrovimonas sp.]|nr:hypothetical protein [Mangrovimonas sp.]HPF97226.1 hypothetical protein [Mangrovimonas sp.]